MLVRYHKEKNKDGLFKNIMPVKGSKYYIFKKPWHITLCKVTWKMPQEKTHIFSAYGAPG
jgi:hypothetical protein